MISRFLFFFFSSRRRHTRYWRDWSSDVCSSDLVRARRADLDEDRLLPVGDLAQLVDLDLEVVGPGPVGVARRGALVDALRQRSEERRVGKECRSRWSPYH